VKFIYRIIALR